MEILQAVNKFLAQVQLALDSLSRVLDQFDGESLAGPRFGYTRQQTLNAQDYLVRGLSDLSKALTLGR